jgi:hypothetical protein
MVTLETGKMVALRAIALGRKRRSYPRETEIIGGKWREAGTREEEGSART